MSLLAVKRQLIGQGAKKFPGLVPAQDDRLVHTFGRPKQMRWLLRLEPPDQERFLIGLGC